MKPSSKRWGRRSLRLLPVMRQEGSITAGTRSRFSIYEYRCENQHDPDQGGRGLPTLLDPPSQIPQPHLEPLKKAGEGQELAGEHPYPYDDYEAGARRR